MPDEISPFGKLMLIETFEPYQASSQLDWHVS